MPKFYILSTDSVIVTNEGTSIDPASGFHFSSKQDIYVAKLGKRLPANGTYSWVLRDYDTKTKIYQQNSHTNSPGNYVYKDVTSRSPIVLKAGAEYAFILYGLGVITYNYQGNTSQIGEHLNYFDTHFSHGCDTNSVETNSTNNRRVAKLVISGSSTSGFFIELINKNEKSHSRLQCLY